jgi:hypothetical protein
MHRNLTESTRISQKEPTRCNRVAEFIIPMLNSNCNFWFYIRLWLLAAAMAEPTQLPATKKYVKSEAAITVFELLLMGGVSPETC